MATHVTFAGDTGHHVMRPDCPCGTRVDEVGVVHHAATNAAGRADLGSLPAPHDTTGPGEHVPPGPRLT